MVPPSLSLLLEKSTGEAAEFLAKTAADARAQRTEKQAAPDWLNSLGQYAQQGLDTAKQYGQQGLDKLVAGLKSNDDMTRGLYGLGAGAVGGGLLGMGAGAFGKRERNPLMTGLQGAIAGGALGAGAAYGLPYAQKGLEGIDPKIQASIAAQQKAEAVADFAKKGPAERMLRVVADRAGLNYLTGAQDPGAHQTSLANAAGINERTFSPAGAVVGGTVGAGVGLRSAHMHDTAALRARQFAAGNTAINAKNKDLSPEFIGFRDRFNATRIRNEAAAGRMVDRTMGQSWFGPGRTSFAPEVEARVTRGFDTEGLHPRSAGRRMWNLGSRGFGGAAAGAAIGGFTERYLRRLGHYFD